MWWGWLDLNQRPIGYEPTALTTELHPLIGIETNLRFFSTLVSIAEFASKPSSLLFSLPVRRVTDTSIPDLGPISTIILPF